MVEEYIELKDIEKIKGRKTKRYSVRLPISVNL